MPGRVTSVTLRLAATPEAPARARRSVEEACSGLPGRVVDDATLLTSELVSNAVKYAGGPVIVAITCDRRKLSVEVHDPSPTPPVVRPPSAARPGGRGMWLVATLAREWGCRADDDGKTVWFSLAS